MKSKNVNEHNATSSANVTKVKQLFARIIQEIEEKEPANIIHFIVDFLCKHYPRHLAGFASVWNAGRCISLQLKLDPDLESDRLQVIEFFKFQKLPTEIAAQFTSAGFDTLETLCTITPEALDDIEKFNQATWLPGHRVRLQQTFTDIVSRVRVYRQIFSATSVGPNPMTVIRPIEAPSKITNVTTPLMSNVVMSNQSNSPYVVTSIN